MSAARHHRIAKGHGTEDGKTTAVILLALGIVGHVGAQERDFIARFEGGIGVIPAQNGAGPVNGDGTFPNVRLNIVSGVNPGGGPWRIADLRAEVDAIGRIKVRGRGLLLASGNSIGQNANQTVFATLICEAAAPFVEHSTVIDGSARTKRRFPDRRYAESVPVECPSPVLLIRNANGVWFAAGIPALGDD